MTTIKLKISNKSLEKVLWLLSHFQKDEVQVIQDDDFESDKRHVQGQYKKFKAGKTKLVSIDKASQQLDALIAKHEG